MFRLDWSALPFTLAVVRRHTLQPARFRQCAERALNFMPTGAQQCVHLHNWETLSPAVYRTSIGPYSQLAYSDHATHSVF